MKKEILKFIQISEVFLIQLVIQHTYITKTTTNNKKTKEIKKTKKKTKTEYEITYSSYSSCEDLSDSFEKMERLKQNIELTSEVELIFKEVYTYYQNQVVVSPSWDRYFVTTNHTLGYH